MSSQLHRLVVEFRAGELVVRTLYRRADGPNPGTKARAREVQELTRISHDGGVLGVSLPIAS